MTIDKNILSMPGNIVMPLEVGEYKICLNKGKRAGRTSELHENMYGFIKTLKIQIKTIIQDKHVYVKDGKVGIILCTYYSELCYSQEILQRLGLLV